MSAASAVATSMSKPSRFWVAGSIRVIGFQSPVVPTRNSPLSRICLRLDCASKPIGRASIMTLRMIFFKSLNERIKPPDCFEMSGVSIRLHGSDFHQDLYKSDGKE